MEHRTVSRVANESDEDVPVSDYSDNSDYEAFEPSDDNDDPLNRCYIFFSLLNLYKLSFWLQAKRNYFCFTNLGSQKTPHTRSEATIAYEEKTPG